MKKLSNKILLAVLIVLIGIFALSRVFRAPSLEGNLQKSLVQVDTATVDQVKILVGDTNQIVLKREGGNWTVQSNGNQRAADRGSINSMLGTMKELVAERMVSRKKEKWDVYQVGEQGTRVTLLSSGSEKADVYIGKAGFNQGQRQSPYGGGGAPYTYVRLAGENDVYAVDGFLVSQFNRGYDDWRNKNFTRIRKEEVVSIRFNYPDTSFVLQKQDSVWRLDGEAIETNKVDTYLNKLQVKNLYEFADDFSPGGPSPMVVRFDGANGTVATIQGWVENERWVVTSNLQSNVYFDGTSTRKDLFPGRSQFVP